MKFFFLAILTTLVTNCSPSNRGTTPTPVPIPPPVVMNEVDFWLTKGDQSILLKKQSNVLAFGTAYNTYTNIEIDDSQTFQTFLGIGGAITDASAEVFAKLPKDKQQEFLDAYYSKDKGIGYTLMRTNIHSCDFSSGSYTFVEEGDKELKNFQHRPRQEIQIAIDQKSNRNCRRKNDIVCQSVESTCL